MVAGADAQHQSAPAQNVDIGDLVNQSHGIVKGEHQDSRSQPNRFGSTCTVRCDQKRGGTHTQIREVVLGKPGDVEAERLGLLDLLDDTADDLFDRQLLVSPGCQIEKPDRHLSHVGTPVSKRVHSTVIFAFLITSPQ